MGATGSAAFKGAAWLKAPDLLSVMDALGTDHCRVVGGAVRDFLIGRAVRDIDIATDHQPEEASTRLRAAGIKVVPTGIAHGTVTAVVGGRPFEVTTLRHDVESFGRHARVAFHGDWEADAARGDFTMNALYMDAGGNLYDYFGGQEDLLAGRVRFIGDAAERIAEDALRILRFFRFHAWYGRGAPDADGLRACRQNASLLEILSIERVRDELLKLLGAPDPVALLQAMQEAGILERILPEAKLGGRLETLITLEHALEDISALRRLAALLDRDAAALLGIGKEFKLSNADARRLAAMATGGAPAKAGLAAKDLRAMVFRIGAEAFIDRAVLDNEPDDADAVQRLIEDARAFTPPTLPVTGHDLEAGGVAPGPAMGEALRALEEAWVASDFSLGKKALLATLPGE